MSGLTRERNRLCVKCVIKLLLTERVLLRIILFIQAYALTCAKHVAPPSHVLVTLSNTGRLITDGVI